MPNPIEPIRVRVPEVTVIEALPPPVVNIPSAPPVISSLRPPVVNVPVVEIPTYEPILIDPSTLAGIPNVGATREEEQEPEESSPSLDMGEILTQIQPLLDQRVREPARPTPPPPPVQLTVDRGPEVEVPFLGPVPVPQGREIALAGTTAFAATGAALVGRSALEYLIKLFKPVANKFWLQLKKALGRDFTDYELQLFFALQATDSKSKKVLKRLKKEQQEERLRQFRQDAPQSRQSTPEHKETEDGTSHQLSMPLRNEEV